MSTPRLLTPPPTPRFSTAGSLLLTALLLISAGLPAWADPEEDEDARQASSSEPVPAFARVRYLDGPVAAIRQDGATDELALNLPIYAGDRIDSQAGGRVELQLPDGTMLRLDRDTEVEVLDLLDPSYRDASPTLIGISSGAVQIDLDNARGGDALRIDTPAASIYALDRGSFRIDIDRDDVVRISVERGRVEVAGERDSVIVASGQRASVRPGGRPGSAWRYNVYAADTFDRWVADRDDVYETRTARGREYDDLPDEVRPYYGELSRSGRWVWADEWGWVWRPGVDNDWRPYSSGYWSSGPWGPVWVSSEPWGWCTSRYGRWDWRIGAGWVWIPGRVFSPAHVYWYYGPEYVGWCPLGWWDRPVHLSISLGWGHSWFNDCPWWFIGYDHFYYNDVRRHQPPRGAVTADLRRGVVSRNAVVHGRDRAIDRDVVGGGKRRVAIPREALDRTAFDRAKAVAARHNGDTKLVSGVTERNDARQHGQPSFRERERTETERRAPAHGVRPRGGGSDASGGNERGGTPRSNPQRPRIAPRGERPTVDTPRRGPADDDRSGAEEPTPRVRPRVQPRGLPPSVPRRSNPRERIAPHNDNGPEERSPAGRSSLQPGDDSGRSAVRDFLGRVGRPHQAPANGGRAHPAVAPRRTPTGGHPTATENNPPSARPNTDRGGNSPGHRPAVRPRDTSGEKSPPKSGGNTSGNSGGSKSRGGESKPRPRGGGGGRP